MSRSVSTEKLENVVKHADDEEGAGWRAEYVTFVGEHSDKPDDEGTQNVDGERAPGKAWAETVKRPQSDAISRSRAQSATLAELRPIPSSLSGARTPARWAPEPVSGITSDVERLR